MSWFPVLAAAIGFAAVERHVARWRDSDVFRRHPQIGADAVVREYLRDALVLLVEHPGDRGLDRMLTDALRRAALGESFATQEITTFAG